jgi:hypothetical protein
MDPGLKVSDARGLEVESGGVVGSFLARWGGWMVAGVAVLVCLGHLSPHWDSDPDSVSYLSIARAISEGELSRFGHSHLYYTPVYPAMIAPTFWLESLAGRFFAISVIHAGMMAMLAWGAWWWLKVYSRPMAVVVTLLLLCSVGLWAMQRVVRPEVAFMAALFWGAGCLARGVRDVGKGGVFWRWVVLGSGLAALSAAIRPLPFLCIGAAMVMTVLLMRGRIGVGRWLVAGLVLGAPSGAVVYGWIRYEARTLAETRARQAVEQIDFTYFEMVKAWGNPLDRVLEGTRRQTGEVGRLMLPGMRGAFARAGDWLGVNTFVYLPLFAVVCVGWWRAARSSLDAMVWMSPFYFLLFVYSVHDQGTRFMVPLIPVFWWSMWHVLEGRKWRVGTLAALAGAHLLVSVGDRVIRAMVVARENREFSGMVELSRAGEVSRGPVVTHALGLKTGDARLLMFMYGCDRWVVAVRRAEDVPAGVSRLLVGPGVEAPAGFVVEAERAGVTLQRREAGRLHGGK